jgi:hypothetical protein
MGDPQTSPDVPNAASPVYTADEIPDFMSRLQERPRRLHRAVIEEGDILADFLLAIEPLPEEEERRELLTLTNAALGPLRKPARFKIESTREMTWRIGN